MKFASSPSWKLELLYLFKIIKIKKPSWSGFWCNEGTGTEKLPKLPTPKCLELILV